MPSLFDEDWVQGTIVEHRLAYSVTDIRADAIVNLPGEHSLWVLTDQDCDLDQTDSADVERLLELRAVYPDDPDRYISGIVGRWVRLSDGFVCFAHGPRIQVVAAALSCLKGSRRDPLPEEQRREFKTWLGLRYDRPAVPRRFSHLPKALLRLLKAKRHAPRWDLIRDILICYEDAPRAGDPPLVDLRAVLISGADAQTVSAWLQSVRDTLDLADDRPCVIRHINVRDASGTSLAHVESYYALDSAKLSLSNQDEE